MHQVVYHLTGQCGILTSGRILLDHHKKVVFSMLSVNISDKMTSTQTKKRCYGQDLGGARRIQHMVCPEAHGVEGVILLGANVNSLCIPLSNPQTHLAVLFFDLPGEQSTKIRSYTQQLALDIKEWMPRLEC